MEKAGRKLTYEGMEAVKKLDTNKNGKLDEDEVDLGDDADGEDYNINIGTCTYCSIGQCMGAYACGGGGYYGRHHWWGK